MATTVIKSNGKITGTITQTKIKRKSDGSGKRTRRGRGSTGGGTTQPRCPTCGRFM